MSAFELHWFGIFFAACGLVMLAYGTLLPRLSKRLAGMGPVLQRFGIGFLPAGALLYFRPDEISLRIATPMMVAGTVWGIFPFMRWWDENRKRPTQ